MSISKIWLSSPHMGGSEQKYVQEAFDTNWVAPLGPNVTGFEQDLENYLGHYEFDAQLGQFQDEKDSIPKINEKADFCIGKHDIFVNGVLKVK